MSVVDDEEKRIALYFTEGLIRVCDSEFSPVNVLELTGRILVMLEELKDYLIQPEEIVLSTGLIFVDQDMRKTRICPVLKNEVKDDTYDLLLSLKELTDEMGRAYLDVFTEAFRTKNYSTVGFLSLIEDLKKEAGME